MITPYYHDSGSTLFHGDCRAVLRALPAHSIATVLTDPPYGLTFMGKGWDYAVPGVEYWAEVCRVVKPGGMVLVFGGTRTYHRLACAIEDAGFEIRDCLMWLYGSGFPKSHNMKGDWHGYGTALKPAWEPILLAMKPLDGTFAENALTHGVAGLHIDGGRIGTVENLNGGAYSDTGRKSQFFRQLDATAREYKAPSGRWPANLLLDDEAAVLLDEQSGERKAGSSVSGIEPSMSAFFGGNGRPAAESYGDRGGASRFFYVAKAGKRERGDGNTHPTVKPIKLMEYLCQLTRTPTGGTVLDPFAGSGTTLWAAQNTGRQCIGIEIEEKYCEIAAKRLAQEVLALS